MDRTRRLPTIVSSPLAHPIQTFILHLSLFPTSTHCTTLCSTHSHSESFKEEEGSVLPCLSQMSLPYVCLPNFFLSWCHNTSLLSVVTDNRLQPYWFTTSFMLKIMRPEKEKTVTWAIGWLGIANNLYFLC